MDVDGDGVLSMYELEYFYTEQVSKMDALGIETMVFQDCLCQVWVLIVWAEMTSGFLIQLVFCNNNKKNYVVYWC